MTNIYRVRVIWNGIPTGNGVATYYAGDPPITFLLNLRAFYEAIKASLPASVNITAETQGDIIDDTNGALTGGWSGAAFEQVNGTDTAPYPAPAGAVVTWTSDGLPWGYRVRGRTYLVPLGGGAFGPNGTLDDTKVGQMRTAAATLVGAAAGNMKIWNRPRKARAADGSRPAVTARDGSSWDVVSSGVKDRVAVLTSRRD